MLKFSHLTLEIPTILILLRFAWQNFVLQEIEQTNPMCFENSLSKQLSSCIYTTVVTKGLLQLLFQSNYEPQKKNSMDTLQ